MHLCSEATVTYLSLCQRSSFSYALLTLQLTKIFITIKDCCLLFISILSLLIKAVAVPSNLKLLENHRKLFFFLQKSSKCLITVYKCTGSMRLRKLSVTDIILICLFCLLWILPRLQWIICLCAAR